MIYSLIMDVHAACLDPTCPDCNKALPRKFAHLHQHTQYSLLDGAAKIKDLLSWVKEVTPNNPCCAITDHGNMHGAVSFYNYATGMGVKPIIGYEAYVAAGSRHDRSPRETGEKGTFHLTLLARNFQGYQNLCRLTSRGYLEGYYYKPRIDRELLAEHSAGVIALSGCLGAEVPQYIMQNRLEDAEKALLWYLSVFKENYFIEIQDHGLEEDKKVMPVLREWAKKYGIGMVATNDGHYVKKEDAKAHDTLLAIQTKTTLDDPKRFKFSCDEFYVKSLEEMQTALPVDVWGEEPFDNTAHIADLCQVDLPVGRNRVYQMPQLPIPQGRTMHEELRIQTYQGTVKRYSQHFTAAVLHEYAELSWQSMLNLDVGAQPSIESMRDTLKSLHFADDLEGICLKIAKLGSFWEKWGQLNGFKYTIYPALDVLEQNATPERKKSLVLLRRAEYELSVINNMGFPDYFLIVADYINWAKNQGITVGPGRGSGAGSLVAYAVRITNLDPLEFDLLFERFLNPDRVSMPDFDIDFSDARREEVIQYVRKKYGDDKVAQIATFGTLSSKACLKDVARVMGLGHKDVDFITKLIPVKFGKSYSLEEARKAVPEIEDALKNNPDMQKAYQAAQKLEGLTRHASVHAAGVVIGKTSLTDLVPLMRDNSGQGVICQYDMKAVEDIGLIKMDFLGLRTLSFLEEAARILKESKHLDIDFDAIPFEDAQTFELLSRGDTKGVFQLEGTGIASASRQLKPKRLADIVALSALYRPGPMENIPTYVRRHHGQEEVTYQDFPNSERWLEPILRETYGIPVYQEQIMQIASSVAGYSLGGADLLRRAMGKKDAAEMQRQRLLFVEGSDKNNVPAEEANKLFDLLEKFANYGFNKSHSAAYGVISYQTAWLKANHPVEFIAALLTVERRDSDKVAEYIGDARKMGVVVLPPDINKSGADFKVEGHKIYFGLFAIKNLGENAVLRILEEKAEKGEFKSLADFCVRIDSKLCNRRAIENLIKAGAFDAFGQRRQLIDSLENMIAYGQSKAKQNSENLMSLFGEEMGSQEPALVQKFTPYSGLEQLSLEKEALGLYISGHPLEQYEGLREAASCKISALNDWYQYQPQNSGRIKVVLAGMIESISKKPTKSGGMMARFNLADESGTIELVAFGRSYDRVQEKLKPDAPALVIVEIESQDDSLRLMAAEVILVDELQEVPKVAWFQFNLEDVPQDSMLEMASLLDDLDSSGTFALRIRVEAAGEYAILETQRLLGERDLQRLNEELPWLNAHLAYDNQTIMQRFAPKPQQQPWKNRGNPQA